MPDVRDFEDFLENSLTPPIMCHSNDQEMGNAPIVLWPSGGMADAGDLKSPVRNGRVGSTPTSATIFLASKTNY